MDFEQDYLMRMIKQMVKAIIQILLGKDSTSQDLSVQDQYNSSDGFYRQLLDMVNKGQINEAENLLYEKLDYTDQTMIKEAISFYGYLNEFDDDFLIRNNYSREEIKDGLKTVAKKIGMESIIDSI